MKKISIILMLAVAVLAMPSCRNGKKAAENSEAADYSTSTEQAINEEALKADLAALMASAKKFKPIPFVKAQQDGKLVLSEREKMVKPEYLVAPAYANELATLYQKYRAVGVLTVDKNIAEMYEMPTADYGSTIVKLLADINDPALNDFFTLPAIDIESNREAYEIFVDEEYKLGRANYFWDGLATALVEQVYILTRDVDKFMPMFTDELASEITYNFVCVHDGISKMVSYYPEMSSLNEILNPLYVINAITVDELKNQLLQVKGDVEKAREALLK